MSKCSDKQHPLHCQVFATNHRRAQNVEGRTTRQIRVRHCRAGREGQLQHAKFSSEGKPRERASSGRENEILVNHRICHWNRPRGSWKLYKQRTQNARIEEAGEMK